MTKPYYQDDAITIYHGDCRDILPTLGPVDLVLTDPPYGEVSRPSNGLRNLDKGCADDVFYSIEEIAGGIDACLRGSVYVWCGTEQVSYWRAAFDDFGMSTRLCIWEKTNPSPMNGEHIWLSSIETCVYAKKPKATFNEFCQSPVWRVPSHSVTDHPTEKPLLLFKRLVQASSNAGDTILDPFVGSGTTLRAAKDLGRKAIGIEISEAYCEIAAKRMSQTVMDLGVANA